MISKQFVFLLSFLFLFLIETNAEPYHNRTKRQTITGVFSGINGFGSVVGSIIKILELPGRCCRAITHDYCGDGSKQKNAQCCGYGRCNIGCCNCDNGCRRPAENDALAIVFHHRWGKGSTKAFPIKNGECWNMEWYNDKISDILAIDCVTVWEHHGCTGEKVNIKGRISDLGQYTMKDGRSWNDQISSISVCPGIFSELAQG